MNRSLVLFVALIAVVGFIVALVVHDFEAPARGPGAAVRDSQDAAAVAPAESLSEVANAPQPVERAPETSHDASVTDSLAFEIVGSDGTPVPQVRVVLTRAERVLQNRYVESGGVISFPPQGLDVEAFIFTSWALRLRHHLDTAVGRHVLRLPAGVTLRGSVLVDGATPKRMIPLQLNARQEDSGLAPLPLSVQRRIKLDKSEGRVTLGAKTDASGRFEFRDVPATWTGTLTAPSHTYTNEEGHSLKITDVSQEVVLRLRERPGINGRVLMPDSSTGVANAQISYTMVGLDGARTFEVERAIESEPGGWFRIGIKSVAGPFKATIGHCGIGRASIDVADIPATGLDLGDVVLQPTNDLQFLVRDRAGRPIEGATASTFDELRITSRPTDGDGLGTLCALPPATDRFRVRAREYRTATRGVSGTIGGAPLEVTMEKLEVLEIAVTERSGAPAPRLLVRLKYGQNDRPSLRDENASGEGLLQLLAGTPSPGDDEYALGYETDAGGLLRIAGLNPLTRFDVFVEDITGATMFEGLLDPSFIGASEPYRIVLDSTASDLEVIVLDTERKPIRGASVSVHPHGRPVTKTLSDGIALFELVYAKHVGLHVDMTGYVAQSLDAVPITSDFERREVVLTRGGSIRVRVVDRTGQPVSCDSIAAKLDGKQVGHVSRCEDDVCHRIDDLPHGVVELTAAVAGQEFVKEHHSSDPLATIEIPEFGSMLVEFSEPLLASHTFWFDLSPHRHDNKGFADVGVIEYMLGGKSPTESLELPVVFPGRYTLTLQGSDPPEAHSIHARVSDVEVRVGERTVVRVPITR
jgi:hypothetical protein